jgi:predicted Holliday junction resolvase-like endonuclease
MDFPATLIFAVIFILGIWIAYKLGTYKKQLEWQKNLVKIRADVAERQRAGIKGKITEAFSPFLPNFPYKSSECKFLGDPIDFVAFEGLDERDVKGIHFVEVKEGSSGLSKHQKQIKDLIDNLDSNKVTFKEFRFDSESSK